MIEATRVPTATVEHALRRALALLQGEARPQNRTARRTLLRRQRRQVDTDLANLVATATRGGAVPAIVEALNRKDEERRALDRLRVPIAFDQILERVVPGLQVRVASPTGFEPVFWP